MTVAIVDIKSGQKLTSGELPLVVILPPVVEGQPDNGTALFSKVGDTRPEHNPLYVAVEEVLTTPAPNYPYSVVSEEHNFTGDELQVSKTYAPAVENYQRAVEQHIEDVAAEKGYSSAVSCASYVTDPNPAWAEEAASFVAWRSSVWAHVFGELAKVQQGERDIPQLDELISELPSSPW